MYKYIIISLLALSMWSCDTTKSTTNNASKEQNAVVRTDAPSQECEVNAMVKDMRGTDGCQFLLQLDNGKKLLPMGMPKMDFEFANNQLVKIGYTEVKDAMSSCMAEDMAVNITCINLVTQTGGVRPAKSGCAKLNGPFEVGWMKDLVIKIKPRKIDRYDHLDGFAYVLKNETHTYLYDCMGSKLCEVEGKASNACTKQIKQLKGKYTIWVVNN